MSFLGLFSRPGNFQFLGTASQSLGELLTEIFAEVVELAEDHPFLGTKSPIIARVSSNHCQIQACAQKFD